MGLSAVTKMMLAEINTYKTFGEFSERFMWQVGDKKAREKYDRVLVPLSNEAFPKIEELKGKKGFKIVVNGATTEFVLVSAKDYKWTVNGVDWTISPKFSDGKALADLEAILKPKKSAWAMLIPRAEAAPGDSFRPLQEAVPVLGHVIAYPFNALENMF
ncbi:MAG: hypothetical protein AAB250_04535, partial [Bdellovibrionota bacterium]